MTIGERIRNRRIELGMTQQELAELIGYKGKTAVSKIEAGERELRQSKIKAMAAALQTSVDYVMGWDETPDQYWAQDDMVMDLYHQLNEEGKKEAQNYLHYLLEQEKYKKDAASSDRMSTA